MKRILCLSFLILLFVCACARAADFTLNDRAVINGMGFRSWYQGYQPTFAGDTVTVCLPVSSELAKGKVTAELIMTDDAVSPLRPSNTSLEFAQANDIYPISILARLHKTRVNGDYPGVVRVTGTDASGKKLVTDFPIVIRVRDGVTSADTPRPRLEEMHADLKTGENCAIEGVLKNASRIAEIYDIVLTITDPQGEILPTGSNKLALGSLLPGETLSFSYPVTVSPLAKASPHALGIQITYSSLAQPYTWSEQFTLPLTQEIRLEHGGAQTAGTVVQGDTVSVSLPVMNMGRGEVYNVLATLSLPGAAQRQSVLLGSVAAGESKTAKFTFSMGKETAGEVGGEITVACEDAWGNPGSLSLPISITVEPAAAPVYRSSGDNAKKETDPLIWILGAGCAALSLALLIVSACLIQKIHRLEEERL